MFHSKRRWSLSEVESAEALAKMLVERTWTLCCGFYVKGHSEYLFLNDATSEDAAFEVAVVKQLADGNFLQVESITVSWCTMSQTRTYIEEALAGTFDALDFVHPVNPRIDAPGQHQRCHLCA